MAVTTKVTVLIEMRETAVDGSSTGQDKFTFSKTYTFVDAAGVLGCTKFFADNRTLNNTTETLDLNGSLLSKLGTAVQLTKDRIFLGHWGGATGTCKWDGSVTNGITGIINGSITVGADGLVLIVDPTAAGRAVAAGTTDQLAVTTTANGAYDQAVGGE